MASSKEYLEFVLEQLAELDEITYRAMMGEYIIYYRGKIVGGIYDDRLLVKPIKSAISYMPTATYELPYDGAREMLLVEDVDNKKFLTGLFNAMYDELSAPKIKKKTHQDVGQMDMYIRMYDELKRSEGDNPTIGIVLCSDTDDDIARYSVMHGNEQLFASKYKLYLPTKEELKAEIETQKAMFYLQQQDNEDRNKNYTFNIE